MRFAVDDVVWLCEADGDGRTRRFAARVTAASDAGIAAASEQAPHRYQLFDRCGQSRVFPDARLPDAWLERRSV